MDSIPQTSGIYQILCTPTGKIYIGSAQDIQKRWNVHIRRLNSGTHENKYLLAAWNKYGRAAFDFSIIECVGISDLLKREQYWIDNLNACNRSRGFNISLHAGAPMAGRKHSQAVVEKMRVLSSGRHHSEDTKRMMSERNKGKRFGAQTEESARKRSETMRGFKHSPESIAKMQETARRIQTSAREYIIVTPTGETFFIINLSQFCRDHDLSADCMLRVARGYMHQHKGYTCRYPDGVVVPPPKPRAKTPKKPRKPPAISPELSAARSLRAQRDYVLTDPQGVEHYISNLSRFAAAHKLDVSALYRVMRGEQANCKGWICRRR